MSFKLTRYIKKTRMLRERETGSLSESTANSGKLIVLNNASTALAN